MLIICQKDETSHLPEGRFSCLLLSCHTSVIHVFNCIQSIFDYYEEWEGQLVSICHQNGSLSDLLEISQPVFKNPLCIMNMDFSLVAHRGLSQLPEEQQIFENHTLRLDYIHALIQDENFHLEDASPKPFLFPAYLTGHRSLNIRLFHSRKRNASHRCRLVSGYHSGSSRRVHSAPYAVRILFPQYDSAIYFSERFIGPHCRLHGYQPSAHQCGLAGRAYLSVLRHSDRRAVFPEREYHMPVYQK